MGVLKSGNLNMLSSGKFAKRICNARLLRFALQTFLFVLSTRLTRRPASRIKYLFVNVFKKQVKLLLVVMAASDTAHSSRFTGSVTRTRKGEVQT